LEKQDLPTFHKKKIVKGGPYARKLPLFGESIFTSFRTYDRSVPFLADHLDRLQKGSSYFYPSQDFNSLKIKEGLKTLISTLDKDYRYRVTLYPEEGELDFFISTYHLPGPSLKCDLIKGRMPKYPSNVPSIIKWGNNYGEIFHELKWAQKQGLDEVLFYTRDGFITECSFSNIFLIKKGEIFTPKPNNCFLTGIIRNNLIKEVEVIEKDLTFDDLKSCDEVFLTNSVRGIIPVTSFEGTSFKKTFKILEIYKKMVEDNCE